MPNTIPIMAEPKAASSVQNSDMLAGNADQIRRME
jgi:hypothetical protein